MSKKEGVFLTEGGFQGWFILNGEPWQTRNFDSADMAQAAMDELKTRKGIDENLRTGL